MLTINDQAASIVMLMFAIRYYPGTTLIAMVSKDFVPALPRQKYFKSECDKVKHFRQRSDVLPVNYRFLIPLIPKSQNPVLYSHKSLFLPHG